MQVDYTERITHCLQKCLQVFHHFGCLRLRTPIHLPSVARLFPTVTVNLTLWYHPQSNIQNEWKLQEIGRYLLSYCHENQDSWSHYLPWTDYAQNSLRETTTGADILGYQPLPFPWSGEPLDILGVHHWFQESEWVWDSTHIHLHRTVRRHKSQADARRSV